MGLLAILRTERWTLRARGATGLTSNKKRPSEPENSDRPIGRNCRAGSPRGAARACHCDLPRTRCREQEELVGTNEATPTNGSNVPVGPPPSECFPLPTSGVLRVHGIVFQGVLGSSPGATFVGFLLLVTSRLSDLRKGSVPDWQATSADRSNHSAWSRWISRLM